MVATEELLALHRYFLTRSVLDCLSWAARQASEPEWLRDNIPLSAAFEWAWLEDDYRGRVDGIPSIFE